MPASSEGSLHGVPRLIHRGRIQVRVGVASELDAAVAEDLADNDQPDAHGKEQGGAGVTQIVEAITPRSLGKTAST